MTGASSSVAPELAVGAPEHAEVPSAEAPLILRGVVKSWPSQSTPVLDSVDLTLEPGTTAAISGRNGAGKTTLLRVASGLIMPEIGTVSVRGLDAERDRTAFQRSIGYIAAGNTGLYARLKVEHHLELWSRLALMPRSERRGAVERTIDAFDLAPLCGRRVDRLSMGQRQRLRLALGFVHDPFLALLDEPATSLDGDGIALLQRTLDGLKARGAGALVCLPSGWETVVCTDRELVLVDGRLEDA